MTTNTGAVALVLAAALALAGCAGDDEPSGPADPGSSAPTTPPAPGDQYTSSWEPTVPAVAADPATVEADYAAVLDAVVTTTETDDVVWAQPVVTTETFRDETCVVKVQRTAGRGPTTQFDELQAELAFAVSDLGFDDLTSEDDPGGAVRFVAHDAANSLLEYRSKGETTIAVRVATVPEACDAIP